LISLKARVRTSDEPASKSQEISMPHLLKALPLMAAIAATPALAQTADQHEVHHPNTPAAAPAGKPAVKPSDTVGCPGATGQSMGAHMADGHMANSQAMADYMAKNQMMAGAGGQGAGASGMMGGAAGGQAMANGQMMGGATGGQAMGPGAGGMMAGAQNPNCPNVGKAPAPPKK
jgi:hypothetical protein